MFCKKLLFLVCGLTLVQTNFGMQEALQDFTAAYHAGTVLVAGVTGVLTAEQFFQSVPSTYALYKQWAWERAAHKRIEQGELEETIIGECLLKVESDPEFCASNLICDKEKSTSGVLCLKYAGKTLVWFAATSGIVYFLYSQVLSNFTC